jgi:50S ribosomal subunit-associated GTPase HflX
MVVVLWGYHKRKVFISKPSTIEELKQKIKEEIAAILKQMTCRVMENRRGRLEQCSRNGGGHLNDEIFKNKMACTEFFSDSNV